ncbi:hypothetical protein M5362_02220 [Streptomyces sp. Je 1-79]|uniref:hypothetical protein n=1 Tax=Streptomyces sp. Je 1-79 TaxID=2943847 RepID=UPI0021A6FC82|nr:hypothetical protein [Streptomyces sp. Je 1-79]MCT4351951.1 hypothetical protein [Streptomyces sp. Je 1-79]
MDASVMTAVVAAAVLVCRAAVLEIRTPGAGRRAWAFATDRRALGAGAGAGLALGAVGWATVGGAAVLAWAVLAGILVASLTAERRPPPGE